MKLKILHKKYGSRIFFPLLLGVIISFTFTTYVHASHPHQRILLDNNGTSLKITDYEASVIMHGPSVTTTETITFKTTEKSSGTGHFYLTVMNKGIITAFSLNKGQGFIDATLVKEHHHKVVIPSESPPSLINDYDLQSNTLVAEIESLESQKTISIRVEHIQWIPIVDKKIHYSLPLSFTASLNTFSLNAKSATKEHLINVREPYHFNRFSKVSKPSNSFHFEQSNFRPNSDLEIELFLPEYLNIFVETDPKTGKSHAILSGIKQPDEAQKNSTITKLSFIWDASGSMDAQAKKIALVELAKNLELLLTGPNSAPEIEVQLRVLRHNLSTAEIFVLTPATIPSLITRLFEIPSDGGTSFQELAEIADDTSVDLHILATDGHNTIAKPSFPIFKRPLFIAATSKRPNLQLLQSIASRNNGRVFSFSEARERKYFKDRLSINNKFEVKIANDAGQSMRYLPLLYAKNSDESSFDIILPNINIHEGLSITTNIEKDRNSTKIEITDKRVTSSSFAKILAFQEAIDRNVNSKAEQLSESTHPLFLESGMTFKFLTQSGDYFAYEIEPDNIYNKLPEDYASYLPKAQKRRERLQKSKRLALIDAWERQISWWERESLPAPAISNEVDPVYQWQDVRSANRDQGQMTLGTQIIQPWEESTPYLSKLAITHDAELESTYYELREQYAKSPAFFLDASAFFLTRKKIELAEQILSNVQELMLDHMQLNRIIAHRYLNMSKPNRAHELFELIYEKSHENPQAWREYALSLADRQQYASAVNILRKLIQHNWPNSPETELLTLIDLNQIVNKAKKEGIKGLDFDSQFERKLDFDFLMTVSWDATSPMDFWTAEPDGTLASNLKPSSSGGVMNNITNGGLASYSVRKAVEGEYKLQTNPVTKASLLWGVPFIVVESYTNFGRNNEERQLQLIKLPLNEPNVTVIKF